MDEERFKKACINEEGENRKYSSTFSRHMAYFMLRQDAEKFMLGKYFSNQKSHERDVCQWLYLWQKLHQQPVC